MLVVNTKITKKANNIMNENDQVENPWNDGIMYQK